MFRSFLFLLCFVFLLLGDSVVNANVQKKEFESRVNTSATLYKIALQELKFKRYNNVLKISDLISSMSPESKEVKLLHDLVDNLVKEGKIVAKYESRVYKVGQSLSEFGQVEYVLNINNDDEDVVLFCKPAKEGGLVKIVYVKDHYPRHIYTVGQGGKMSRSKRTYFID